MRAPSGAECGLAIRNPQLGGFWCRSRSVLSPGVALSLLAEVLHLNFPSALNFHLPGYW